MSPRSILSTTGLARFSGKHPWAVVAAWVLVLVVAGTLVATQLSSALTTEQDFTNDPESKQAVEALRAAGLMDQARAREIVIVRSAELTVDDPAFAQRVGQLSAEIAGLGPDVVQTVATFYVFPDPSFVSRDRHTTLIPVIMAGDFGDAGANIAKVIDVVHANDGQGGFDVLITGDATLGHDFQVVSEEDLRKGETFGIAVALLILLIVFGTVVSALLPILIALVAIGTSLGLTAIVGQFVELSFFVTNMITMMGLAVGIDYSLFIVSRFREELRHGRVKLDAIEIAGHTANRAVFFSGMTVVLALIGMLLVPTTVFFSLAMGAILVVISAVLASLTLLPAVLGILGGKVNALPVRPRSKPGAAEYGGFWEWITNRVMGRPVVSLAIAGGVLIAASIPYFSINLGFAGVSTLPEGLQSKRGFKILQSEFTSGATTNAIVAVKGDIASPGVQAALEKLKQGLAGDDTLGSEPTVRVAESGLVARIDIPVQGDPVDDVAVGAVRRIHDTILPAAFAGSGAQVLLTGQTAGNIDFLDLVERYAPIVFGFVLSLSFMLLMVVFRSVVVPLKAIVLNLLSVGAAYGMIVLVTQQGFLVDVFGFTRNDVVEAWIPLFLFSVLFGLSMDYHVFLLSRVKERYDQTGDNTGSVAFGLRSTASLITGAALIMVAVFGGFAAGEMVSFQQMGFGLAVAVLVDATIVRSVLVPASMKLLGKANWYFPSFLSWVPRVGIEGDRGHAAPAPAAATVAGGSD
ncbi:MAG: MMPL family transporter [SAR202 cluster bacterium]|nr:MMPL family transporter [SAR202 cluster bacterium]